MKNKRLYGASFEESQNLVDKKFVMKSLKESSNKQDNGRLEGKIFTFLLGPLVFKIIKFVVKDKSELAIPSRLIWSGKIFNILFFALILSIIFILESVFCKIRYSKQKANREYSYTTRIVAALSLFCVCGAAAFLSLTGSALNSVFMECFYVVLIIFLFWLINHKLNQNILNILYHQENKKAVLSKAEKVTNLISKYVLILAAICFLIKVVVTGYQDLIGAVMFDVSPLLMACFMYVGVYIYKQDIVQGYYLKKYSEQYRQLYGFSKEEWYGVGIKDDDRMKLIEKHLKEMED
ncbi:hypothetical protein [Ligilactobacillus aviarius]|uniref:hypothetical protein n=1 Tax=Ligilactobacillus aviarius TaxID=1606 RepID=UPI00242D6239|nr:hypothetical protein [Ligilactobacillus aviarius]